MRYRIIIADDHHIFRQGLQTLLEKEPDMQVVGDAADGREALNLARKLIPHLVLMDVKMPDLNGIEATQRILTELPQVKVIALSMYSDRNFIGNMFKAGASGYLLKNCAFEELTRAVRVVMSDQFYLTPEVAGVLVKDYGDQPAASGVHRLTSRELEVLRLLAEGKRPAQIAKLLQINIKTVDAHRHKVMEKLNLRNVAELTKYAIREGLIPLEG